MTGSPVLTAVVAAALKALLAQSHITSTPLQVVFDETLEYEFGVGRFRSQNQELVAPLNQQKGRALLLYNRTQLRPDEYRGQRFANTEFLMATFSDPSKADGYRAGFGEIIVSFLFASPSDKEMEAFESAFLAWRGLPQQTQLTVPLGILSGAQSDLGTWTYFLKWSPLAGVNIESKKVLKWAVAGAFIMRGWWPVLVAGQGPVMSQNIELKIATEQGETLVDELITSSTT